MAFPQLPLTDLTGIPSHEYNLRIERGCTFSNNIAMAYITELTIGKDIEDSRHLDDLTIDPLHNKVNLYEPIPFTYLYDSGVLTIHNDAGKLLSTHLIRSLNGVTDVEALSEVSIYAYGMMYIIIPQQVTKTFNFNEAKYTLTFIGAEDPTVQDQVLFGRILMSGEKL